MHQLTLTIEGTPTVAQYVKILCRLQTLLNALAEDVAPGVKVRWVVQATEATPLETHILPPGEGDEPPP